MLSVAAAALGVLMLALCRLTLNPRQPSAAAPEPERSESLQRWQARTETLISWSEGTRADWDSHLRPLLVRELRKGAVSDPAAFATLFGPRLWPWIDPSAVPRGPDQNQPGPGRAALAEILDRLDTL